MLLVRPVKQLGSARQVRLRCCQSQQSHDGYQTLSLYPRQHQDMLPFIWSTSLASHYGSCISSPRPDMEEQFWSGQLDKNDSCEKGKAACCMQGIYMSQQQVLFAIAYTVDSYCVFLEMPGRRVRFLHTVLAGLPISRLGNLSLHYSPRDQTVLHSHSKPRPSSMSFAMQFLFAN